MRNVIILLGVFLFSFTGSAQVDKYEEALKVIINSDKYKSYTKNQKKYHVSDELIIFSKMGKMFKSELAKYDVELSDHDIIVNDKKDNLKNVDLLSLNKRKCSKLKIYFSEEREGIFFAELIKETKEQAAYDKITHFGISYMFMFQKVGEDDIKLIDVKTIDYN